MMYVNERVQIRFHTLAFLSAATLLMATAPARGQASAGSDKAAALVQQMQAVEDSWDTAINKRNQYALEGILSPQLIDIAATGDVTTRNQDIVKLLTKETLPASMQQKVLTVRALRDGLVLVSGTYTLRWPETGGLSASGSVDEKGIFTHVFENANGRWECLNSQRTVVAAEMPQPRVKAATPRAKSNAAEPFHVPLVYKGAQSTQPPAAAPPR